MDILGLVMMIVGAIGFIGGLTFIYLKTKKFINAIALEVFDMKKEFITYGLICFASGVMGLIFTLGIPLYFKYACSASDWTCLTLGGLFLGIEIPCFLLTFRIHYYQTKLDKKIDKWLYIIMIAIFPVMILTLWLLTEGLADHIKYPLVNGLGFKGGLHWTTAETGGTNIAWYALCILSGAILVYFICDHFLYKEYGRHGIVDSTFLLAFPSGIIGARIFYVIGNWDLEFGPYFNEDPWKMFKIWNGGLTILGGAITGIVVGVLWFMHKNKDIPIGRAVNIIVPTILIAQAVGRWGNFFNAEVHGVAVDASNWQWLPSIILGQMQYSSAHRAFLPDGQIYVPLFLIESLINIAGYYILFFGFGKLLKKYVKGGDLAFGYVIWYGLTRTFMEPLRDGSFNMGTDGKWSWIWSIIFIGIGAICIIGNHIIRWIYHERKDNVILSDDTRKKYLHYSIIGLAITGIISFTIFGVGLGLYLNNSMEGAMSQIALVPHNIGLIMWIVGACLIPSMVIPGLYLYKSLQKVTPEVAN